jgi:ankyrin repeat protein
LDGLPESLDETYERTLLGIEKEKQEYAHRLFQCLSVAVRPLRVDELAEMLAIRFDDAQSPLYCTDWQLEDAQDLVLSACSSLIAVVDVDGSPVVQFSHFSVKEFLTSDRLSNSTKGVAHYHVHPYSAHTTLSQASLCVLLHLGDRVDKNSINKFPFAQYAAQHWVDHARFEDISFRIQDAMESLFDMDEPSFATWIWIYDLDYPFRQHMFEDVPPRPEAGPLYYAALCGFSNLVEHLIANHPEDINARGGHHGSAVNVAFVQRNIEITLLLLQNGANANVMDDRGQTPLCIASRDGRRGDVEFLLEHRADVNLAQDLRGQTPLVLSASNGELEITRILLRHGATVDTSGEDGRTPLMCASHNGHLEIARLLIQNGAAVDSRHKGQTPLMRYGVTPLHMAAHNGNLDIVILLLESGANVNLQDSSDQTPLDVASASRNHEVTRCLANRVGVKCPCDAMDARPLGKDSGNPVPDAALGSAGIVKHTNIPASLRGNALHEASAEGSVEVVQSLLDEGADVNQRGANHETALHDASWNRKLEVAKLLIKYGADVNCRSKIGWTPLHVTSSKGHCEIVELLLDHGADLNTKQQEHWTPLHLASWLGRLEVVKLLLERGADIHARDIEGRTPYALASRIGHRGIQQLLTVPDGVKGLKRKWYANVYSLPLLS